MESIMVAECVFRCDWSIEGEYYKICGYIKNKKLLIT